MYYNYGTYQDAADIRTFYGLNRTRRGEAGEFGDMKNMSSAEYPCAAPRRSRVTAAAAPGTINAAAAPDSTDTFSVTGFTGVSAGAFWYNGNRCSGKHTLDPALDWEIVRLGNLYIINGCGKNTSEMFWYNIDTKEFDELGRTMDNLIVTSGTDAKGTYLATFRCALDAVAEYSVTDPAGRVIRNQDFFDEYGDGYRLPAENIFEKQFDIGEEVTISGFPTLAENVGQVWSYSGSGGVTAQRSQDFHYNNTVDSDLVADLSRLDPYSILTAVIRDFDVQTMTVSGTTVYVHYVYFALSGTDGGEMTFDSMYNNALTFYCSGVSISRRRRVLSHIYAYQNRIWGTTPNGNRIYVSSSDADFSFSSADIAKMLAARLNSDTPGQFTALAAFNGEALAFKEESISVISGTNASNYTLYTIEGCGCIDGRSVAVTPSGVIFLAHDGFYIWSGNVPQLLSDKLRTRYTGAVGGWSGQRYYASAWVGDSKCEMVVYDMRRGLWHTEDDLAATAFFTHRGEFYICDSNTVWRVTDTVGDTKWSFTLARTELGTLDYKAVQELHIYADIEPDAEFTVYTIVENGAPRRHTTFTTPGLHVFRCPVRALHGSDVRIRFEGRGGVTVHEIKAVTADGGRRYKSLPVN